MPVIVIRTIYSCFDIDSCLHDHRNCNLSICKILPVQSQLRVGANYSLQVVSLWSPVVVASLEPPSGLRMMQLA
eukprot:m.56171 g.56171  ORF g.56171 m.56171 type:complete len:74 (+) comp12998_c2_seq1:1187-1408(+)